MSPGDGVRAVRRGRPVRHGWGRGAGGSEAAAMRVAGSGGLNRGCWRCQGRGGGGRMDGSECKQKG